MKSLRFTIYSSQFTFISQLSFFKKIKLVAAILLTVFILFAPAVGAVEVLDEACRQAPNSPACQTRGTTENPVVRVINVTATILALLAGVIAVIMLIIGGFNFITAGGATPGQRAGDPNKIADAQRKITYSLVGLLVIALAWAITRFITSRVIQ